MNDLEITRQVPDTLSSSELHAKIYRKKRAKILHELRSLTGIPEVLRTLNPDETYKIVSKFKPTQGADGFCSAVIRKNNGEIVEHVKLQKVGPSLVKCATAIGSQILLISIAMQLNRVEKGISEILEGLHDDRMAEIAAGKNQYDLASDAKDRKRQLVLTSNAIQTLTEGVEKALRALPGQIRKMPNAESGIGDDWPLITKDRRKVAKDQFKLVQESFCACVVGIQTLAECYVVIDEPHAGRRALSKYIEKLGASENVRMIIEKARLVPVEDGLIPEAPLQEFKKSLPQLRNELEECHQIADGGLGAVEVEIKPKDILTI